MTNVTPLFSASANTPAVAVELEKMARGVARELIALPGWAIDINQVVATLRASMAMIRADDPSEFAAVVDRRVLDRVEAILREAAGNPMVLIERYPDLLPTDLVDVLAAKAVEALKDAGATVETFKDDEGTTFLRLANVEALGIPASEMERLATGAPGPVGSLHRLQ